LQKGILMLFFAFIFDGWGGLLSVLLERQATPKGIFDQT
jgi:hypothetical protein